MFAIYKQKKNLKKACSFNELTKREKINYERIREIPFLMKKKYLTILNRRDWVNHQHNNNSNFIDDMKRMYYESIKNSPIESYDRNDFFKMLNIMYEDTYLDEFEKYCNTEINNPNNHNLKRLGSFDLSVCKNKTHSQNIDLYEDKYPFNKKIKRVTYSCHDDNDYNDIDYDDDNDHNDIDYDDDIDYHNIIGGYYVGDNKDSNGFKFISFKQRDLTSIFKIKTKNVIYELIFDDDNTHRKLIAYDQVNNNIIVPYIKNVK